MHSVPDGPSVGLRAGREGEECPKKNIRMKEGGKKELNARQRGLLSAKPRNGGFPLDSLTMPEVTKVYGTWHVSIHHVHTKSE